MWVVLKYKPKEFEILKNSFFKILGEMPEFYNPKYKYERYINNKLKTFEKNILNNFQKIVKKEKKIDVLIYNVYSKPINYYQKFEQYNLKTWEKVMKTNLTGAFLCSQHMINHFRKKKTVFLLVL